MLSGPWHTLSQNKPYLTHMSAETMRSGGVGDITRTKRTKLRNPIRSKIHMTHEEAGITLRSNWEVRPRTVHSKPQNWVLGKLSEYVKHQDPWRIHLNMRRREGEGDAEEIAMRMTRRCRREGNAEEKMRGKQAKGLRMRERVEVAMGSGEGREGGGATGLPTASRWREPLFVQPADENCPPNCPGCSPP